MTNCQQPSQLVPMLMEASAPNLLPRDQAKLRAGFWILFLAPLVKNNSFIVPRTNKRRKTTRGSTSPPSGKATHLGPFISPNFGVIACLPTSRVSKLQIIIPVKTQPPLLPLLVSDPLLLQKGTHESHLFSVSHLSSNSTSK